MIRTTAVGFQGILPHVDVRLAGTRPDRVRGSAGLGRPSGGFGRSTQVVTAYSHIMAPVTLWVSGVSLAGARCSRHFTPTL